MSVLKRLFGISEYLFFGEELLSADCREDLCAFLRSRLERFDVVVMPDFFLDRFIDLGQNVASFSRDLESIVRKKGGSIDGIAQTESRGGNAVNTASALAALGARVTPIVCATKLGLQLLRFHLGHLDVDFSHVKVFDKASITTALEFENEGQRANVMLRDVGSLSDFGPHHLGCDDFEIIRSADYVCVFNWAGTRNFGTELATTAFHQAKNGGKGKTYCDTADPLPNEGKIQQLIKGVLQNPDLDVLSVNENEAVCYASRLSRKTAKIPRENLSFEEMAGESARILASHLLARVDLHTTSFSATFKKEGETTVPAFEVPVFRATGAGDAWNAGNILGDACGLSDDCRLTLANAVAAYYVSSPDGTHPTRKQLLRFCEKLKPKKH